MTEETSSLPAEMLWLLRRYLPEQLYARLGEGNMEPVVAHLQAVLRAVLTYVPGYLTRSCLEGPCDPSAVGEFVEATMLYADISGFTPMSERLTQLGREGAEIITSIVNDYFAAMVEVIARYKGDLFKFAGDALSVCFRGEGAVRRCCLSALEMQQAMERFALVETPQGNFQLQMKVGISTGRLLLATLGGSERLELLVVGSAVRSMSQAEELARPGEVVLDQVTFTALDGKSRSEALPGGFFRLTALPDVIDWSTAIPASQEIPLAGELDILLDRLESLRPCLPIGILERIVAAPGTIMIEGEHRLVTVLFANIYGIDDYLDRLAEDQVGEVGAILNRHFAALQEIVNKYGGVINKVDTYAIGYRVMAVFGAPVAHENDPEIAVLTALEMQEALNAYAEIPTKAGLLTLKQRVGINTGYVFAGNLGSALRQEYSVMGDEVNLAARLMGLAGEGEVVISETTAQHVRGSFEWQVRPLVSVKGKTRPLGNFLVTGRMAHGKVPVEEWGGFYGRKEELGLALRLVDAALQDQGSFLDITGEAGVGKSRLVAEVRRYAEERGMEVVRGNGVSYGQSIPYWPWLAVLHQLFAFRDGESQSQRRGRLVKLLDGVGLGDWAPVVGAVLGVSVPETILTRSLDAKMRQQRFFDVVLQIIQDKAVKRPLFIIFDDMYWADTVSLDLVSYVSRNLANSAVLMALIRRPSREAPTWSGYEHYHLMTLTELDAQVSLQIATGVLGSGELAEEVQALILERSQGNPLFVEEVTRALNESGTIRLVTAGDSRPTWEVNLDAQVELPTSLTGLIMSRIDRLETTNRRLLQVAAVIGGSFRASVLGRIYPYDDLDGTLEVRMSELVRLNMTLHRPPDEYLFRHNLTQEVAYGSLPFARRRRLHVLVGEDIELNYTGNLEEQLGVLAHHFDEGRVYDKAFHYLVRAGEKARAEYANQAAVRHLQRALEIASEEVLVKPEYQSQVCDILEALGDVNLLISNYDIAIEKFWRSMEQPACPIRRRADLLRKVGNAYEQQAKYDEAMQHLDQARLILEADEGGENSVEMARICYLSGWIHRRRAEMDQAIQECQRGLEILDSQPSNANVWRDEADLFNTLGSVYVAQGNYTEGGGYYRRSTELRQQAGDLPGLARSYNNLALVAWSQGDLVGASDNMRRMLEISKQIGNPHFQASGLNNLGAVLFKTNKVGEALEYYQEALVLQKRIGDKYAVAQTTINIGEGYLKLQQNAQARRFLEEAARLCEALQSESDKPDLYCLLAEVELNDGQVEAALGYAQRARDIAAGIGNSEWQGVAERNIARSLVKTGQLTKAREAFQASLDLLQQAENQLELGRSYYEYGSLLAALPVEEKTARLFLRQAAEIFDASGAEDEAAEAMEALAGLTDQDRQEDELGPRIIQG